MTLSLDIPEIKKGILKSPPCGKLSHCWGVGMASDKGYCRSETAVSEVIGILLLVALVVILAAFIAAGVFGLMGPGMTTKNVALVASPGLNTTSPTTIITIHGGLDLDQMTNLEYTLDNATTWGNVTDTQGNELIPGNDYPLSVGQVVATGSTGPEGKRLMLRGTFGDGSVQILYDKQF